jgi:hypothetical protein
MSRPPAGGSSTSLPAWGAGAACAAAGPPCWTTPLWTLRRIPACVTREIRLLLLTGSPQLECATPPAHCTGPTQPGSRSVQTTQRSICGTRNHKSRPRDHFPGQRSLPAPVPPITGHEHEPGRPTKAQFPPDSWSGASLDWGPAVISCRRALPTARPTYEPRRAWRRPVRAAKMTTSVCPASAGAEPAGDGRCDGTRRARCGPSPRAGRGHVRGRASLPTPPASPAVLPARRRLPAWQVALLTVAAVAALLVVLHWAGPRSRARRRGSASSQPGEGGPRCFPLSDTERVKLVGPQNKAAHRRVATASEAAQALFDLGLLQAWGFERFEAAANFEARRPPTSAGGGFCRGGVVGGGRPKRLVAWGSQAARPARCQGTDSAPRANRPAPAGRAAVRPAVRHVPLGAGVRGRPLPKRGGRARRRALPRVQPQRRAAGRGGGWASPGGRHVVWGQWWERQPGKDWASGSRTLLTRVGWEAPSRAREVGRPLTGKGSLAHGRPRVPRARPRAACAPARDPRRTPPRARARRTTRPRRRTSRGSASRATAARAARGAIWRSGRPRSPS